MSASLPTPGPWRADYAGGYGKVGIYGADGVLIGSALQVGTGDDRIEKAEANARLIAAAPDLYEALADLKSILDRAESNASGNPEWESVSKRINAARTALSKADGRGE